MKKKVHGLQSFFFLYRNRLRRRWEWRDSPWPSRRSSSWKPSQEATRNWTAITAKCTKHYSRTKKTPFSEFRNLRHSLSLSQRSVSFRTFVSLIDSLWVCFMAKTMTEWVSVETQYSPASQPCRFNRGWADTVRAGPCGLGGGLVLTASQWALCLFEVWPWLCFNQWRGWFYERRHFVRSTWKVFTILRSHVIWETWKRKKGNLIP